MSPSVYDFLQDLYAFGFPIVIDVCSFKAKLKNIMYSNSFGTLSPSHPTTRSCSVSWADPEPATLVLGSQAGSTMPGPVLSIKDQNRQTWSVP